ncbi:MAG: DUF6259 domain-containing protein [Patescibacteria group bacterium]|nr:DUF6259 domain-containing protein [Patescibacteria group bacterium]
MSEKRIVVGFGNGSLRAASGVLLLLGTAIISANGADLQAGDVSLKDAQGELTLETPRWAMALDAASGAIRWIEDRNGSGKLVRGGKDLWRIVRRDESDIDSSACTFRHEWNAEAGVLTLAFDGPDAAVSVLCTAASEGPAWQAEVRLKRGTMLGWQFPVALEFDVPTLDEFIFPDHLGLAFSRSFFEPGGAGVQRHPLGPAGMLEVTGDRCRMGSVRSEPVAVRPGKDAEGWLPEWYLKEMPRWQVTANRCPAGGKHDLSLVETDDGSWLSGYRLGGWGWLFRFGGIVHGHDSTRPQMASVIATLAKLFNSATGPGSEVQPPEDLLGKSPGRWPEPPRRIGFIVSRPNARPGARQPFPVDQWINELRRQKWVADGNIEIEVFRDPANLRAALAEPRKWFAMVNTLPEGFPAESPEQANSMLTAIRDYVRDGGVWWEAGGGYSFYHALTPAHDMAFRSANRAFCDFATLSARGGRLALFGVQSPDELFVPAESEIAASGPADRRVGRYSHLFHVFGRADEPVRLPLQQMTLGSPHREVLKEYARRNQFTRSLTEKASADVVERLKRSILLKVNAKTLREQTQIAESLPFPVLFHTADYLLGGFDRQYPDLLPPNPEKGTPADLAQLVNACREKGHLFMPYTNPTWWCTNPKGPTFEREGEAPLSRDFEGNIYPESYGLSTVQGYTICAWHPAVRAANDVIREQFTREYPVDVLFQDQVGARGHRWDTNPAAPRAGAYLEGIHQIARVDSAVVPLGTEDGHDRLINWEVIFSGLSWPWLPNRTIGNRVLYDDLWPAGAWRIEPLALLLAHDKVLFYHHDLGGFVRDRLDLSVTLAMGYGLSWWTHTPTPSAKERDWIERLCRVQAAVGPRCAGQPLDDFEYLAPQVLRSRYGDLEIIANLSPQPWPVNAATTIAPEGFLAQSPDLEAGIFVRRQGQPCDPTLWLIRQRTNGQWSEWSAAEE